MRMSLDTPNMPDAATMSGSQPSPSGMMKNIIQLSLTFGADEDIFASFPLAECTSLTSLSIIGGKVGALERPPDAPQQFIKLADLRLADVVTHDASDDRLKLGNVLSAVLDPFPISEIERLTMAGPYGALYEDPEGKQAEVASTAYHRTVKLFHITFDRRASTYDHFIYLSQVVIPKTLQTVTVKLGRWKDVEGLRALLVAAGQLVTYLDISITRLVEHEECQDQSGPLPPWNLLADCVAACPSLRHIRLYVKPCRSGLINAAKEDFDPTRYTPFETVLRALPQTIEELIVRFVHRWDTHWEGVTPIWDLPVLDEVLPSPRFPYLRGVWIEFERTEAGGSFGGIVPPFIGRNLPKLTASKRITFTEYILTH